MQIFPLVSDTVPAAPTATDTEPTPESTVSAMALGPRVFIVVYRKHDGGALWKVDVVADDAIAAALSVVYAQNLTQDLIVGVIDQATQR